MSNNRAQIGRAQIVLNICALGILVVLGLGYVGHYFEKVKIESQINKLSYYSTSFYYLKERIAEHQAGMQEKAALIGGAVVLYAVAMCVLMAMKDSPPSPKRWVEMSDQERKSEHEFKVPWHFIGSWRFIGGVGALLLLLIAAVIIAQEVKFAAIASKQKADAQLKAKKDAKDAAELVEKQKADAKYRRYQAKKDEEEIAAKQKAAAEYREYHAKAVAEVERNKIQAEKELRERLNAAQPPAAVSTVESVEQPKVPAVNVPELPKVNELPKVKESPKNAAELKKNPRPMKVIELKDGTKMRAKGIGTSGGTNTYVVISETGETVFLKVSEVEKISDAENE